MGTVAEFVLDPVTNEKLRLELPLTFHSNPGTARAALGLGSFVDLSDPLVAKAVALAAAARSVVPRGLLIAYFGGVAHRLRCPSSNRTGSVFRRTLHDLDLACRQRDARSVVEFLKNAGRRHGSGLTFVETAGDRIFNSLSEGRRFRLHDVRPGPGDGVVLGTVDLVADEFRFCHRLDFRSDIDQAADHQFTVSPTLLLLAKLQFIQRIPAADAARVPERVLGPFGKRNVIIGPDNRDVRDILALLIDVGIGESNGAISISRFRELLAVDWGLWNTVRLNLSALSRSSVWAALEESDRATVQPRLAQLIAETERLTRKRRFGFLQSRWWEEVDALPVVDVSLESKSSAQPDVRT